MDKSLIFFLSTSCFERLKKVYYFQICPDKPSVSVGAFIFGTAFQQSVRLWNNSARSEVVSNEVVSLKYYLQYRAT